MNALLDRCIVCGQRTWRPGEPLCIRHDIQALIALSAERMRPHVTRYVAPATQGNNPQVMNHIQERSK